MNFKNSPWDPEIPNQHVRLHQNPGKRGRTTGKTRRSGTRVLVQVDFGPQSVEFKNYDLLEPCPVNTYPLDEFKSGSLGTISDIRKLLVLEKVRGRLTNVLYSMESSNTIFYPHQFKPVMKFIESPVGRLLIADEVGLGKTIEAGFVWKELKARENARRLLVVCPAILREKWRDDLLKKFSIHADLVDAKGLLQRVRTYLDRRTPSEFVCICSLQGIRPPRNFEDDGVTGVRAELARILDANVASTNDPLFDLVVIDEAHYMRNRETLTNHLGRLLRDSSRYSLLLTATPTHIDNDNLFQLLRLVSPEDFYSKPVFDDIMAANKPVTHALRSLWRPNPDYAEVISSVEEALQSRYFKNNSSLKLVLRDLKSGVENDRDQKIKLGYRLEDASLLGHFMSRSRKRDIPESNVKRSPQVLTVKFSPLEQKIYEFITNHIRNRAQNLGGARWFSEIARQTQMASCMVAALKGWSSKGFLGEVLEEGLGLADWELGHEEGRKPLEGVDDVVEWPFPPDFIDYDALERGDSKYNKFIDFLRKELNRNPTEKFVVFSFFRGTLDYLSQRLGKDGISSEKIMGGMGDEKWNVLRRFKDQEDINVLLSSEVGSEGIDLQFCQKLVNYDLPWNPMRVEQRIGRLDRLGQKAEQITIVNLSLVDTIEGRILDRLYSRIRLFEESIGDLEEILGEMTEQVLMELFDPKLNDQEREANAEKVADAVCRKREEQDRLETKAINLVAFSEYVLDSIAETRNIGRWLKPIEIMNLVQDFLAPRYVGTELHKSDRYKNALKIRLSSKAKTELGIFMQENQIVVGTNLHQAGKFIECLFDPKQSENLDVRVELVDPTHPLVRWIRNVYDNETFHGTAAIKMPASATNESPGIYGFTVQKWTFTGMRSQRRLVFAVKRLSDGNILDEVSSESLINTAIIEGETWENAWNILFSEGVQELSKTTAEELDENLQGRFDREEIDFKSDNENFCDVQEASARGFADRRLAMLEERVRNFEVSKPSMIPATQGLMRRENDILNEKLNRIEKRRMVDISLAPLCFGMLLIE